MHPMQAYRTVAVDVVKKDLDHPMNTDTNTYPRPAAVHVHAFPINSNINIPLSHKQMINHGSSTICSTTTASSSTSSISSGNSVVSAISMNMNSNTSSTMNPVVVPVDRSLHLLNHPIHSRTSLLRRGYTHSGIHTNDNTSTGTITKHRHHTHTVQPPQPPPSIPAVHVPAQESESKCEGDHMQESKSESIRNLKSLCAHAHANMNITNHTNLASSHSDRIKQSLRMHHERNRSKRQPDRDHVNRSAAPTVSRTSALTLTSTSILPPFPLNLQLEFQSIKSRKSKSKSKRKRHRELEDSTIEPQPAESDLGIDVELEPIKCSNHDERIRGSPNHHTNPSTSTIHIKRLDIRHRPTPVNDQLVNDNKMNTSSISHTVHDPIDFPIPYEFPISSIFHPNTECELVLMGHEIESIAPVSLQAYFQCVYLNGLYDPIYRCSCGSFSASDSSPLSFHMLRKHVRMVHGQLKMDEQDWETTRKEMENITKNHVRVKRSDGFDLPAAAEPEVLMNINLNPSVRSRRTHTVMGVDRIQLAKVKTKTLKPAADRNDSHAFSV